MKYKITAHLDFTEDVLEVDDDLTEEEVEKELYEYVSSFFDWNYKKVEDEQLFFIDFALAVLWLISYFSGTDKLKLIFEIVLFLFIRDTLKGRKRG